MNNEEIVDSFYFGCFNPKITFVILLLHYTKIVQDRNYFLSYTIYGTKNHFNKKPNARWEEGARLPGCGTWKVPLQRQIGIDVAVRLTADGR